MPGTHLFPPCPWPQSDHGAWAGLCRHQGGADQRVWGTGRVQGKGEGKGEGEGSIQGDERPWRR